MIRIENIVFSYDKKNNVLNIDNLEFLNKGLYCIIGPNGAGKSTFIKIIAGILLNYRGNVYFNNNDIKTIMAIELSKIRSYVPQNTIVNFKFTVEQFISFGQYRNMNILSHINKEYIKKLHNIMELFEIEKLKHKFIGDISGGELQKVHIARALFQDTDLILLDEPISNIDIHYKFFIMKHLKELSHKKLIIYITHDINTALNYNDEIIVLRDGGVILKGKSEYIVNNFEKIYDKHFIIEKIKNKYVLIDEE